MSSKASAGVAAVLAIAGHVMTYEGYRDTVYLDPVGLPTVCWGHMDPSMTVGTKYSRETCSALLNWDLQQAADAVSRQVKVPLTRDQFGALVSFIYNVGPRAFATSTLRRKLNQGDYQGAAEEFDRWVYARGKKLEGLVARRREERRLFEKDIKHAPNQVR